MFLGAVPWEILIDVILSLLIQWQWPVRQCTGLTKNAGHPCWQFLSCLSPRLLVALALLITASQFSSTLKLLKNHYKAMQATISSDMTIKYTEKV